MFHKKIYPYLLVFLQLSCLLYILTSAPVIATGYAGILIESAGIFLGVLAIVNMGLGNFNISPKNKENGELVSHGIYGVIRHPMYFAQLVAVLPLIFDYFSWLRLIAFVVLLITLLLKIQFEESQLIHHYPGYSDYKKKTKRLIPFLF